MQPWQIGTAMGALVAAGRLELSAMCAAVLVARGPEEEEPAAPGGDSELIELGHGLAVLGACLQRLAAMAGEAAKTAAWRASGCRIARFVPAVRRLCQECIALDEHHCKCLIMDSIDFCKLHVWCCDTSCVLDEDPLQQCSCWRKWCIRMYSAHTSFETGACFQGLFVMRNAGGPGEPGRACGTAGQA